jgi:predicted RNA-binding protein
MKKPLVFLPCANANKTRAKYGKKMFSHSTTHQFLSAITRCDDFERVVASEPLTIVPYALEGQHPDYNVPPDDLTIQDEAEFTIRLANWLNIVKRKQPRRKYIYYIGGTHHYFILQQANEKARKPFKIIYEIPEGGVKGYSSSAKHFKEVITNLEEKGVKPELKPVSLEKHIKSRGRYTNRKFWEYITVIKNINTSKKNPIFQDEKMPVALRTEYYEGFLQMYPANAIKSMKEGKIH